MGRRLQAQILYVYMNNRFVGSLLEQSKGMLIFKYAEEWLSWEFSRPVSLSLPLTNQSYSGNVVYNFFDNLLPDSKQIRDRIQQRFKINNNKSFDILMQIGADCVGALQLSPIKLDMNSNFLISGKKLTRSEIAYLLKNYKHAPLGMQENSEFRISMAGAQEKTALLWHADNWYLPTGTTPTTHIFKLPIGRIEHAGIDLHESVENEYLCLNILQTYGLPTAKAKIEYFEDVKVLIVERFDRIWRRGNSELLRVPQEDICQALGVSANLKYESDGGPGIIAIMKLLLGSENAEEDRYKFMHTTFLFWILAAIDGHAKNFSLLLQPGGRFKLAPLYDVISAYPLIAAHQLEAKKIKMAMAVRSQNAHYKWHEIKLSQWLAMAELCKFPKQNMHLIIEQTFDTMENVLDQIMEKLPAEYPIKLAADISQGMRSIKNRHSFHK